MIRTLSLFYAASDLTRAAELFSAALGVEFAEERNLEATTYFAATLPGDTKLELWPAGTQPVTRAQLEFAVPDLHVAAGKLDAAGFEVRRPTGTVLVTDPNRNTVALTAA